jgi:hypothetical protein
MSLNLLRYVLYIFLTLCILFVIYVFTHSQAKKILLTQLRFLQCLRDGAVPPVEVVDFLCPDDHTYSRLQQLAGAKGGGAGKENTPTPTQSAKKTYNPIFQVFLQAAGDKASKPTLETCVALTALSASVVLAGSGDLDTLTILRILRNKLDETTYGTHLGGGGGVVHQYTDGC